jgi:hypothetical protein
VELPGLLLQIFMRSMFEYGSKGVQFLPHVQGLELVRHHTRV